MRQALSLPLLLLPLLLAAPPAQAQEGDPLCIIFIEASPDFQVVRFRADLILDLEERTNVSRAIDTDGDGDLTAGEVAAYEEGSRNTTEGPAIDGTRTLYLDGAAPLSLFTRVQLRDWTGPVASARNGTVTEHREYRFGVVEDRAHVLTGGLGAHPYRIARPVIETVVFQAPAGWIVHSVSAGTSVPRENETVYRERSVTIQGFDLESQYAVVYAREGTDPYAPDGGSDLPAPGVVALIGLLALLALARRARR